MRPFRVVDSVMQTTLHSTLVLRSSRGSHIHTPTIELLRVTIIRNVALCSVQHQTVSVVVVFVSSASLSGVESSLYGCQLSERG